MARVSLPFDRQCQLAGLPVPTPEYQFAKATEGRKWQIDWCFVTERIAVEVEGGAFKAGGGRHTRGAGFRNDLEKYNALACHGYRLIRVLPEQIANGEALTWVDRILRTRAA